MVTHVLYFKRFRKQRSTQIFRLELKEIDLVQQYKYLGVLLNEYLNCKHCDNLFTKMGGRTSSLLGKYSGNKNFAHSMSTHLFRYCIATSMVYKVKRVVRIFIKECDRGVPMVRF